MNGNMRRIGRMNRMSNFNGESKVYRVSEQKGSSGSASDCELPLVHKSCEYSGFSLAAAAAALIMFAGIIIYAIIA